MRWCSLDLHHCCSDLWWRKTSDVGAGGNCLDSGVDIRVPVWLSKTNGEQLLFLLQKLLQLEGMKMFASCIWLLNIITRIITVVVVPAPENVTTGGERTRCRKLPVSGRLHFTTCVLYLRVFLFCIQLGVHVYSIWAFKLCIRVLHISCEFRPHCVELFRMQRVLFGALVIDPQVK